MQGDSADPSHTTRAEHQADVRAQRKRRFLDAYREIGFVKHAAATAGISRKTCYAWRDEDPAFREEFDAIDAGWTDELERIATKRAKDGSDDLMKFLLAARNPSRFRGAAKVELTGRDGGPVRTQSEVAVTAEVAAMLGRIDAFAAGAAALPAPSGEEAAPCSPS